jgi:hypothetical protein
MKFKGYGQVWDNEKNKVLIDFENGPNAPAEIEVTDKKTIEKLIALGYKEIESFDKPIEINEEIKIDVTEEEKEEPKKRGRKAK